jgi:peptidoglycan/xylan/chitin deacetylase (PgdA/CDA1 family)
VIALFARALKQAMAATLFRTGLLELWWRAAGRQLRGRPLIVTYHRVLPPAEGLDLSQAGIVVSTSTFERQLKVLRGLFQVVPLAEAAGGEDPELGAITFDDGWADNHTHALPILNRLGLPATLFVTTGLIGTSRLFWPERLAYLLADPARAKVHTAAFDGLDPQVEAALSEAAAASAAALPAALDRLIERAKVLSDEDREQMLDLVAQQVGRDPARLPPRLLTWHQVGEMQAAGIEIGAHGVTHAILTRLEPARAVAEIRDSREQVGRALGRAADAFAYPNGDATPELARAVAEAGYRLAVVTDAEPLAGCPPKFTLQRKNLAEGSSRGVAGFSASIFACEVLGFFDAIRAFGRRRRR